MSNVNWMEKLTSELKDVCFCYLAIPGSHDSLSFSVTPESKLSPDAPKIAKYLNKLCSSTVRKLMYNWCVTQSIDLKQQFTLGIRYFDFRVATYESELYSCHALYGMNIVNALMLINDMLNMYQKEVVILDFQHFYNFKETDHILLIDKIHSIFGSKLFPLPMDFQNLTLNYLQKHNFQVIVVYRNDRFKKVPDFWPSSKWLTPWPNTTDINKLYDYLTTTLQKRPQGAGFVSQCLFTPSTTFIAFHFRSTLLKQCGKICNMSIKSLWIEKQKCLTANGVNVIIADFVDLTGFNFCSTVINLNKKNIIDYVTSDVHL